MKIGRELRTLFGGDADGHTRKVLGRSAGLTVALASSQLLMAVIYAVAARNATPAEFGRAAAIVGVALSVAAFLDFGSNAHWIRMISGGRIDFVGYAQQCAAKLRVALVASVVIGIGTWVLGTASVIGALGVVILLFGSVAGQAAAVPLRIEERFARVGFAAVAGRVAGLVAVVAAVALFPAGSYVLTVALGVSAVVELAVLIAGWTPELRRRLVASVPADLRHNPWEGATVIGMSSAFIGLQSSDVAVAARAGSPAIAGEYAAVTRWTGAIGLLSTAASQVALPRLARARTEREAARELGRLAWLLIPAATVIVVIIAVAPWLVELILGSAYADSAEVLRWLALATAPALLSQPLLGLLQARHHERAGLVAVGIGVPLQLLLVALLAPGSGAVGVAQAALIGQCAILVVLLGATRRMVRS